MSPCFWGLSGLGILAIASPAQAEMRSFTLGGHHFQFDVPADYDEFPEVSDETHRAWIKPDSVIMFSVGTAAMEEELAGDKKAVRRFNGRVGFSESDGRYLHFKDASTTDFYGRVFTQACSGKCVINIGITGHANDPNLNSELHPILDKYLQILGRGGFGGE